MNSARSAYRFRLTAVFIIAIVLAISSVCLNMILKKSAADEAYTPRVDPDYFLENFRHFKLQLTGEPEYEITGKKLTHYPDNDSYLVNFPVMESLDNRDRLQVTYSDWAYMEDLNSKIHMHENVVVIRYPTPDSNSFRLTTDYLLLLPDEDIMKTDRKVIAYEGTTTMTSVGMVSNNATRELFLLSRANVVYPPVKPRNK